MESTMQKVGKWAFIVGICLALVLGIVQSAAASPMIMAVLAVLGLIVGLLNVTGEESREFLLATVSLVIIAALGGQALTVLGSRVDTVFTALVTFIVPAALIVALKSIWGAARDSK